MGLPVSLADNPAPAPQVPGFKNLPKTGFDPKNPVCARVLARMKDRHDRTEAKRKRFLREHERTRVGTPRSVLEWIMVPFGKLGSWFSGRLQLANMGMYSNGSMYPSLYSQDWDTSGRYSYASSDTSTRGLAWVVGRLGKTPKDRDQKDKPLPPWNPLTLEQAQTLFAKYSGGERRAPTTKPKETPSELPASPSQTGPVGTGTALGDAPFADSVGPIPIDEDGSPEAGGMMDEPSPVTGSASTTMSSYGSSTTGLPKPQLPNLYDAYTRVRRDLTDYAAYIEQLNDIWLNVMTWEQQIVKLTWLLETADMALAEKPWVSPPPVPGGDTEISLPAVETAGPAAEDLNRWDGDAVIDWEGGKSEIERSEAEQSTPSDLRLSLQLKQRNLREIKGSFFFKLLENHRGALSFMWFVKGKLRSRMMKQAAIKSRLEILRHELLWTLSHAARGEATFVDTQAKLLEEITALLADTKIRPRRDFASLVKMHEFYVEAYSYFILGWQRSAQYKGIQSIWKELAATERIKKMGLTTGKGLRRVGLFMRFALPLVGALTGGGYFMYSQPWVDSATKLGWYDNSDYANKFQKELEKEFPDVLKWFHDNPKKDPRKDPEIAERFDDYAEFVKDVNVERAKFLEYQQEPLTFRSVSQTLMRIGLSIFDRAPAVNARSETEFTENLSLWLNKEYPQEAEHGGSWEKRIAEIQAEKASQGPPSPAETVETRYTGSDLDISVTLDLWGAVNRYMAEHPDADRGETAERVMREYNTEVNAAYFANAGARGSDYDDTFPNGANAGPLSPGADQALDNNFPLRRRPLLHRMFGIYP